MTTPKKVRLSPSGLAANPDLAGARQMTVLDEGEGWVETDRGNGRSRWLRTDFVEDCDDGSGVREEGGA